MLYQRKVKTAEEFNVGDYILISDKPLEIIKIRHLNKQPYQLYQIFVSEIPGIPIVVPADCKLEYVKLADIDTDA